MELEQSLQMMSSYNAVIKKAVETTEVYGNSLRKTVEVYEMSVQKAAKVEAQLKKSVDTMKEQAAKTAAVDAKTSAGILSGVRNVVGKIFSTIGGGIESLIKGTGLVMGKIFTGVFNGFKSIAGGVLGAVWGGMTGLLSKGLSNLMSGISDKLKDDALAKVVFKKYDSILTSFASIGGILLSALNGPLDTFIRWFKVNKAGITSFAQAVANVLSQLGSSLMGNVIGQLNNFMNWLKSNQGSIIAFIQGIGSVFSQLAPHVAAAVGTIWNSLQGLFSMLGSATASGGGFLNFIDSIGVIIENLASIVSSCINTLAPVIAGIWQLVQQVTVWIAENMPLFSNAINSVLQLIGPMLMDLVNVIQFLWQVWMQVWPTLCSIVQTAWGIIGPVLRSIWDLAMIIVDIFKIFWPYIAKVIEAVWNFLKPILDAIGKAVQWVSGLIGKVRGWFDDKANSSTTASVKTPASTPGLVMSGNNSAFNMPKMPAVQNSYPSQVFQQPVQSAALNPGAMKTVNISLAKLADSVVIREEVDIDKFSGIFAKKLSEYVVNMGVA